MNYLSAANQKSLDSRYRLAVIIVAALGLSTLLYILIGWAFLQPCRVGNTAGSTALISQFW